MSDDLSQLRKALETVGGHLHDMQAEQRQTVRELSRTVEVVGELQVSVKNLQSRSVSLESSMIALNGTFASIEQILTRMLADHERVNRLEQDNLTLSHTVSQLQTQNETLLGTVSELARRVEALERKAS